jgi:hypothetical protein
VVAAISLVLVIVAVAGWASGSRNGDTASPDTTAPASSGNDSSPHGYLRPADTSLSWFFHSGSVEQFDYEMESLSCASMAGYISMDLCAVVKGSNGSFMIVGTEGYWDPAEPNSRGVVNVPLDLTVYVLTEDNGPSRAMSILDGSLDINYDGEPTDLLAYVAQTTAGEALVLHKKARSASPAAYDYWDEVQVISASPTGAPTLVGAYEGSNIKVTGDGNGVMLESDRYASPSKTSREPLWSTFTYLAPATGYPYAWAESVKSGDRLDTEGEVKPRLAARYRYPNSSPGGADA